jgi:hypothetical protein
LVGLIVFSGACSRLSSLPTENRNHTKCSNFSRGVSPGIGGNFIFAFGIVPCLDAAFGHVVGSTVSPGHFRKGQTTTEDGARDLDKAIRVASLALIIPKDLFVQIAEEMKRLN